MSNSVKNHSLFNRFTERGVTVDFLGKNFFHPRFSLLAIPVEFHDFSRAPMRNQSKEAFELMLPEQYTK